MEEFISSKSYLKYNGMKACPGCGNTYNSSICYNCNQEPAKDKHAGTKAYIGSYYRKEPALQKSVRCCF